MSLDNSKLLTPTAAAKAPASPPKRFARRRNSKTLGVVVLGVAVTAGSVLSADNWPQWRGPALNGVSVEKGLPLTWSAESGENIAWKLAMPSRSGATPIVWGDQIFLNVATAEKDGEIELWAVGRAKGDVLWKRPMSIGNIMQRKQNMSTPSPVTDGTSVWVMTGHRHSEVVRLQGE